LFSALPRLRVWSSRAKAFGELRDLPAGASYLGTGDFNDDRIPDVLYSRPTGAGTDTVYVRLVDCWKTPPPGSSDPTCAASPPADAVLFSMPAGRFAGVGDFNADRRADVLLWSGSGVEFRLTGVVGPPPTRALTDESRRGRRPRRRRRLRRAAA
jgi:hypothetical protein